MRRDHHAASVRLGEVSGGLDAGDMQPNVLIVSQSRFLRDTGLTHRFSAEGVLRRRENDRRAGGRWSWREQYSYGKVS